MDRTWRKTEQKQPDTEIYCKASFHIQCETFTLLVGRSQQSVTFGKQRKGGIGRGTSE